MSGVPRTRALAVLLGVSVAATLTSCVEVPHTGPVVTARTGNQNDQTVVAVYNPPPPTPGAAPADIVAGFLEAMRATPLRTGPAKAFLTAQAAGKWHPRKVLVFGGHPPPVGHSNVEVHLRGADLIGATGRWRGRAPRDDARLTFPMTEEDGEWRIAEAPDAVILQRDFYEQNYTSQDTSQNTSLYFFDPTGRILVPEPVHVPQGSQLATALVKGLLHRKASSPSDVERSYFPPGLTVRLSVPVVKGVAKVSLVGGAPETLSPQTTERMLAQLAWTLRQDPSTSMFSLSLGDQDVTDAAGHRRFAVDGDEFEVYDPAYWKATPLTYALRKGLIVSGPINQLTPVNGGPFGTERLGIRRFAVNLDNNRIAAVVPTGLQVGVKEGRPTTVLSGSGLLRPAWDAAQRLWEIQNVPGLGAEVFCFAGGRPDRLRVPGITGEDVRRFLVSRDGSRIVAVIRGANDRIVASRLRYDADGRVTGASRGHAIPWSSRGSSSIRDIGWTSPTTIAVLDRLSRTQAEVRILNVDGSTRPRQVSPIPVRGGIRYLATSPGEQTPYAVQRPSTLINLSPAEQSRALSIDGLHHLTYAG